MVYEFFRNRGRRIFISSFDSFINLLRIEVNLAA
nr:MAG TPA: hypothetical protein [Caudoviricetes sp.]